MKIFQTLSGFTFLERLVAFAAAVFLGALGYGIFLVHSLEFKRNLFSLSGELHKTYFAVQVVVVFTFLIAVGGYIWTLRAIIKHKLRS